MTIEIQKSSLPEPVKRKKCRKRPLLPALWRGFTGKCPNCGKASLFSGWLKIVDICPNCAQELHHHRADDAPPYFTIFIVGHIVLPLMYMTEKFYHPALWVHLVIWLPLVLVLAVLLLPRIKGAIASLQWALCMHGFEYAALCAPHPPRLPDRN